MLKQEQENRSQMKFLCKRICTLRAFTKKD